MLRGTAPASKAHLVLATARSPRTWPPNFNACSPLYSAMAEKSTQKNSPLSKISFAVSDTIHDLTQSNQEPWSLTKPASDETYGAYLYIPKKAPLSLPFALSLDNLSQLDEYIDAALLDKLSPNEQKLEQDTQRRHIYVCTHGNRDCRCGDIGEPVYAAIRREIKQRRLQDEFLLGRISHIGGHKWAANVLDYPTANWYGLVNSSIVPKLVSHMLSKDTGDTPLWSNWRGQLGLEMEEQLELYNKHNETDTNKKQQPDAVPLDEPINIPFQRAATSESFNVRAYPNETLMQAAKRFDLVEATCDGQCECATCHVILGDKAPADLLQTSDEEEDQLEYALDRKPSSRLACQITINDKVQKWINNGGVVGLPRF